MQLVYRIAYTFGGCFSRRPGHAHDRRRRRRTPASSCPILHTQPGKDRWTPQHLSDLVLPRITGVPVETVTLENAGHYPLEEPGLTQMQDAIAEFVARVTA